MAKAAEPTRRERLVALRDRLAAEINAHEGDGRTLTLLTKEYRAVLAEIDSFPETEGRSEVDEVAKKRAERRARTAAQGKS